MSSIVITFDDALIRASRSEAAVCFLRALHEHGLLGWVRQEGGKLEVKLVDDGAGISLEDALFEPAENLQLRLLEEKIRVLRRQLDQSAAEAVANSANTRPSKKGRKRVRAKS